jgi:hypothetical protein
MAAIESELRIPTVIEPIGGPEQLHSVAGVAGAALSREELPAMRIVMTSLAGDGVTMERQRGGRLPPGSERRTDGRAIHFGMTRPTGYRAMGPCQRQTPGAVRRRVDR